MRARDSPARCNQVADFGMLTDTSLQSQHESKIFDQETKYIESTPSGNILTGFDNYTKGITGAAANRRKAGTTEQNRVFSRSSISYNTLNVSDELPQT